MATVQIIFVANDNLIELDGLTNAGQATYVNDATVTCTIKDADGNDISGETWPLAMGYVSASDGKYRAVLEDTLVVTADLPYTAHVDVTGDSLVAHWEIPVRAATRIE